MAVGGLFRSPATVAQINTGTNISRILTPDNFAGSNHGERAFIVPVFSMPDSTDVATGDYKQVFVVPSSLDGMNIVEVQGYHRTAGASGSACTIQLHNITDGVDILSTLLTIDAGETSSSTAATAAVINTDNDDLATHDLVRVDVDAIPDTAPKGLLLVVVTRLP